jgi:hypothetical protein
MINGEAEREGGPAPPAPKKRDRRDRRPKLVTGGEAAAAAAAAAKEAEANYPLNAAATDDGKKRGRKPKGGKLVSLVHDAPADAEPFPHVILHLKCSLADLADEFPDTMALDPHTYNPAAPPVVQSFDPATVHYFELNEAAAAGAPAMGAVVPGTAYCEGCAERAEHAPALARINAKIEELKAELYRNAAPPKKSACFWCTYEFDGAEIYIPKYDICGEVHGYGSFCSPECSAAYLMRERIDDTIKFERYQLLNHVYGAVLGYTHSIKPSPDPHYLLSKFCGKLTIDEYRKVSKMNRLLMTVPPPITRSLPELHDETDAHVLGSMGYDLHTPTGGAETAPRRYSVKRATDSQRTLGATRSGIIKANFGF